MAVTGHVQVIDGLSEVLNASAFGTDDQLSKPVVLSLKNAQAKVHAVTVTEAELLELDLDTESEQTESISHGSWNDIASTFRQSQSQWVDDPVISQWRDETHRIHTVVSEVEQLYHEWSNNRIGPFSPLTDEVWLSTGRVLSDIGLPWHNNQINMPDEVDTSWPFHFKSFERQVIQAKGGRVGDEHASGYVCNSGEAHAYLIRALQQELREKLSNHRPLLVFDRMDREIIQSTAKLLGLESRQVDLSMDAQSLSEVLTISTEHSLRPIIFAATLASSEGEYDDLAVIAALAKTYPMLLHIDAGRNFDYLTTMTEIERERLRLEKLQLSTRSVSESLRAHNGSILASTIVAGGAAYTHPAAVVALKPASLGSLPTQVAYTRASDSTLAGSRDAIAPLWVALQEIRYGEAGFRQIHQYCAGMRAALANALERDGVRVKMSAYSLDIRISTTSPTAREYLMAVGGIVTQSEDMMLQVQPSVRVSDVQRVVQEVSPSADPAIDTIAPMDRDFNVLYPVPPDVVHQLETTVQGWKIATRSAAGYPFHMGSYSALGPIIGQFLDLQIPHAWVADVEERILAFRMSVFGLKEAASRNDFKGAFTNGSTMGNRVGIHTALTHFPHAFLYFSHETHYSVPKTARDCDLLSSRWSGRAPRYARIPCDAHGSMLIDALVEQAIRDRADCHSRHEPYHMILFMNMGTTFVGARDNLTAIRARLADVDVEISYVHVDGALDFGFGHCGVVLAPPGIATVDGVPAVQGLTLSHHKAMGNMVSGEVLCYSPGDQLATLGSGVDPRAVFETWLYTKAYLTTDMTGMFEYCQRNAKRLEVGLRRLGVVTKQNDDSLITCLEKPPAWIVEEFSLRPEGDWVHFITMPHVSTETVDFFLDRMRWVDRQCQTAFSYIEPLLRAVMAQPIRLHRVPCRHHLASLVSGAAVSSTASSAGAPSNLTDVVAVYVRGAMSFVVLDEQDQLRAAFLAESSADRAMRVGPVLVESQCSSAQQKGMLDIARQLMGFVARHLDVQLRTDSMSYVQYTF